MLPRPVVFCDVIFAAILYTYQSVVLTTLYKVKATAWGIPGRTIPVHVGPIPTPVSVRPFTVRVYSERVTEARFTIICNNPRSMHPV